jgi:RNA polymerase sigma-70 factor (ECF subfamily)
MTPDVTDLIDPEAELMLRVQRDEPGAFSDLVRLFEARVFARLVRCLADRHHAEDLTQEVFLRLYRGRKRYQPRGRFVAWIFRIVQNVARNAVRSRRRHAWLRFVPLEQTELRRPEHFVADEASDRLERQEAAQQLHRGLESLLDRQRRAIELQHFEGRSYPEIGRALRLTTNAAKSLLYRARNELRDRLLSLSEA